MHAFQMPSRMGMLVAGAALLAAGATQAAVIPVPSASCADLSAAQAAASPGDVLQLATGTSDFQPFVGCSGAMFITKPLTIQGGGGVAGMATHIINFPAFLVSGVGPVVFDHLYLDGEDRRGGDNGPSTTTAITVGTQGSVRILSSTIAHYGIGVSASSGGRVNLVNSTVSQNIICALDVAAQGIGFGGFIGLFNSTVTDNRSGICVDADPNDPSQPAGEVQLQNSILDGNGSEINVASTVAFPAVGGQVETFSRNIVGTFSPPAGHFGPDEINAGPTRLGQLSDNGGGTPTVALLDGNPGIGAILRSQAVDDLLNPLLVDQRDMPRGTTTSIGAVDNAADALATLASIQGEVAGAASQTSVNTAITDAVGLQNSMASLATAVTGIQTTLNGANLAALDAPVSSRASQASVTALGITLAALSTANLDVPVSTRATQAGQDALAATVATRASAQQADAEHRLNIEQQLSTGLARTVLLTLPNKFGGELDLVQNIVHESFANAAAAGATIPSTTQALLDRADAAFVAGRFTHAYGLYGQAYRALVLP